uniref:Uncharacterized protein n=1 Tax=Rhizophora mucronata TaxID=61149 RepID=A0A2P2NF42_RHIMU
MNGITSKIFTKISRIKARWQGVQVM